MPDHNSALDPRKFRDPHLTADGQERAVVALTHLRTLWFNTGSLCNITCVNCYMESSPKNDALAYMTLDEVRSYLDEIHQDGMQVEEIAFTGGEPFMNPDIIEMLSDVLARDFKALVLTNAMKPMLNKRAPLLALHQRYPGALSIRVSIDHFTRQRHEDIRGKDTWAPMKAKTMPGAAMALCLPTSRFRWMPRIRRSWCCFRKWTSTSMSRKSPPSAGTS
jgi:hypothetical protein